jgi:hypothetical protein
VCSRPADLLHSGRRKRVSEADFPGPEVKPRLF